jgi:benzoate-CoA ligase family protein
MAPTFNASVYLLDRRLDAGDGDRIATAGPRGALTYRELHDLTCRTAAALRGVGVRPEQRVLLYTVDGPRMLATILGAMRIGAVPVPVSTMGTPADLAGMVRDSRATAVVVSAEFAGTVSGVLDGLPDLRAVVLDGTAPTISGEREGGGAPSPWQHDVPDHVAAHDLDEVLAAADAGAGAPYDTWDDTIALWLYTSGTTGLPKGAMHRHANIRVVCETYAEQVLGIRADDRVLSVPKMFFAYGLGASAFFPLSVGAATILEPARSSPATVTERLRAERPTIFVATPSFYAAMLAAPVPEDALSSVRLGTSAGEPLPAPIYERFRERYGVDVIDGLGSTEALHIFISNRPGEVRPGTSGTPVPGYRVRVVDDAGADVPVGTEGHLLVNGESTAVGYWCRNEATRRVFQGEWLRTGDCYIASPDGYYTYLGRSDDMLKVGGIWVSPAEVEARLLAHPDVVQAAVVGVPDEAGLDKPVACVVLAPTATVTADELVAFCRDGLAHFKCPRVVLTVDEIPMTATGKLRRNVVRAAARERVPTLSGT